MDEIFVMLLVAITTAIAYRTTQRASAPRPGSFRVAVRALIDFVGAFAVFFAFNIALGAISILLIRSLAPVFVPMYGLSNLLLPVLSAAQGFVFHLWWRHD